MISILQKRAAQKVYVRQLPLILKKMYGKRTSYSEKQILIAIKKARLGNKYKDYAFAIFMNRSRYDALRQNNINAGDYKKLRREIAIRFFKGNLSFSIHDLIRNASIPAHKLRSIYDYRNVSGSEIGGSGSVGDY